MRGEAQHDEADASALWLTLRQLQSVGELCLWDFEASHAGDALDDVKVPLHCGSAEGGMAEECFKQTNARRPYVRLESVPAHVATQVATCNKRNQGWLW